MNRELQQYRFAWIEGNNITRARLEAQFKDGITDPERLVKAIEQELTETTKRAPWRRSEIEQMGCRDGARMAALEFFWTHRQGLRCDNLAIAQNG